MRVELRSAHVGTEHWSAPLALPTGIALRVRHRRLGSVVLSCAADGKGSAALDGKVGLYVGETYTLEAPGSAQVKETSVDFIVAAAAADRAGAAAAPAAQQAAAAPASSLQAVLLVVERATADVTLAMRIEQPRTSSAHAYAALMGTPSGVRYTLWHRALKVQVGSGYTDQVAKAVLRRPGTLFVGEEYEVRAEGGSGIQGNTHAFVVAAHPITVTMAVSRARGSLDFQMVSALASSSHWAASLPLPHDVGYEVRHAESGTVIFSGVAHPAPAPKADSAAGLAFVRFDRDHSGFLELTELPAALSELGLQAEEAVVAEVLRRYDATADGKLELHEFTGLVDELTAYQQRVRSGGGEVSSGAFAVGEGQGTARGVVDGGQAGLYVGEAYVLVVPATDRFDESAADFVVDEHGTSCVLQLRRAAADLRVVLASAAAGNARHWAGVLPLPGSIPFRIVHKQLGMVVAGGTTDGASRCELRAAGGAVLVGEAYQLQVDPADMYQMAAGTEAESFVVSRRAQEATLRLARQVGTVELMCKPAKAGTAHWSAPLPLPDAIAFNIYHKELACVVANGATSHGGTNTLDATSAPDALFVGEAYVVEIPASAQESHAPPPTPSRPAALLPLPIHHPLPPPPPIPIPIPIRIPIPPRVQVRATSREFVVSSAPQQLPVLVERASGQVMLTW